MTDRLHSLGSFVLAIVIGSAVAWALLGLIDLYAKAAVLAACVA